MPKTLTPTDLEALDRLEEKITHLVNEIGRLRGEHTRLTDENRRLAGELDATRTRLADAEQAAAESVALRQERDEVRTRVASILEQLEGLDI